MRSAWLFAAAAAAAVAFQIALLYVVGQVKAIREARALDAIRHRPHQSAASGVRAGSGRAVR
ncbi:hypothetical protein GCM10009843_29690 [Nocardioides bigeumensis]|jgi:hypothetical protein|uniref:Uncharacterized protein n=1 Tax=Nocardioides bigeumensis TaxID=433657 RepID=A0ABN2YN77_9ACTN